MADLRSRRRKKGQQEEGPKGAPEWVVTFSDMISLLVTFFVLLMTFSSMEEYDLLRIRGILQSGGGTLEHQSGPTAIAPPERDLISNTDPLEGADQPHVRPPDELPEPVHEGRAPDPRDRELDMDRVPDGLRVRFAPEASFGPGDVQPNGELVSRLLEFAEVLRAYPHLVVVEGHADAYFRPTAEFPDAGTIGLARAEAVARLLTERGGIEPERVLITSYGAERPRDLGSGVEARLANRRVELRIAPLGGTRRDTIDTRRQRERTEGRR
jgi:chemotaxis protein MotB